MSTPQRHTKTPLVTDWQRRYEVLRRLGSGGFADVYEAWDADWQRPVALKVVDERRGFSARVLREVQAAAALHHPAIVQLYDYFSDGEHSYLVWELVRGDSLAAMRGRLADAEAVRIVAEVLEALAHAHGQGVVHRDVKPQNIMLDEEGRAKVMDFGIARLIDTETLTAEGDLLGTVAYMSPEQAAGRRAGPASDVYSAAVVLFELLAGSNPVHGATPAEMISDIAGGRALPLASVRGDLPRELLDAVDAAMSTAPAERPTAAELAATLDGVLQSGDLARRRFREAARPMTRAQEVGERFAGAALGGITAALALAALPAYPTAWTIPVAVFTAAVWALLPAGGLAVLLGLLTFPFFNVSLAVGIAWLPVALAVLLLCRSRPVCAVWPLFALLFAPLYAALLAPAAAAVLGRIRGPLTAAWSAGVASLVLSLSGAAPSPLNGFSPAASVSPAAAGDALSVLSHSVGILLAPVVLLQIVAWALLAAALRYAWSFRSLELRLWIWAAGFSVTAAGTALVPAAQGHAVHPGAVCAYVGIPAVVVLFVLVLRTLRPARPAAQGG